MAVAVDIVDAGDTGPEFVLAQPWCGPGGLGARIRACPLVAGDARGRVRGVFERVVGAVELAGFDSNKFGVDREHGVAEAVDFRLGLALGRFDHEGSGDRPAHCGGVESKIHEALGNIFDFDAGALFPFAQIKDALVRDAAGFAFVKDREMPAESCGDVVRVENRDRRGIAEGAGTHHGDIHPGNDQNARAAEVRL